MIFQNIQNINDETGKTFFLELVSLYVKIIREAARKFSIDVSSETDIPREDSISEMIAMGVISNEQDLSLLKKEIGAEYPAFIRSINTFIDNRETLGSIVDKLNNSKRKALQNKEIHSGKPTLVDFFAGAGGLSLGFIQSGFRVCFANDFEEVCINTYRYNHPEVPADKILHEDIRKIVDNIGDYIKEDVDIVVGGPPCQGFSSANQQRIIDDPRNELYKYFIKAVTSIVPKFVVMENVRGMLSVADQVVEDYETIKATKDGKYYTYSVKYRLLNSANFSVAQSRERLIYIAIRNDIIEKEKITPDRIFDEIERNCQGKKTHILSDALFAIKPLKAPRVKNTNEIDDEETGKKVDFNSYNGDENSYLRLINQNRIIPLVFNHKARYVNDINYDIYRLLEPGDDASDEKIAEIMPYKHRLHCFKDKYFKLIPDRPSRTITAHLRMDCHSHIHPFQIRAITPREAARCQSFPDDYVFLGAYLKTYMQIGNAVPCVMARGIAEIIKKHIK